MVIKAINDIIRSNGLIPMLLIFGAYLRITELDLPNLTIEQKATTIKKAIKKLRKIQAFKKINNALRTRNNLGTTHVHDLSLNNPILVYKKKKG